jgi:hypothetical protein
MKRVAAPGGEGKPSSQASVETGNGSGLAALAQHCAYLRYEDGGDRQPGWFKVDVVGSEWCIRVSDPDSECSFVARAGTMMDALKLASTLLDSENCPWAPDRFLKGRAAPKKKK